MREYTVYCILNKVNNKRYIGRTVSFKNRTKEHKSKLRNNKHANDFLQLDWNKYGEENFAFIVIEELTCSIEDADNREIYWIQQYDSLNSKVGYNDKEGGIYGSLTEHTKDKLSNHRKGKRLSQEARNKMSITRTGMKLSEETKAKIGNAHRGKVVSKETISKMLANRPDMSGENHPLYGKHLSNETKQKLSEAHTGIFIGEMNPRATITEFQALNIIEQLKQDVKISVISINTGISKSKIYDIKRGKSWTYLTKDISFNKKVER